MHYANMRNSELIAALPDDFDLRADYANPKSHKALIQTRRGANKREARVWIDHEATGTATTGTGDTVCCWRRL